MNSEDTGIQSILCGMLGEKIETPDSKEFQIHSFSTANCTFSRNFKSNLKEEQPDATTDCNTVWSPASTLQDVLQWNVLYRGVLPTFCSS